MRVVYSVTAENKSKAEELLKKDEIVSRGSITIRSALSLELQEDSYFIIYDGSEEAVKIADALLIGIADRYKDKEKVLKKLDEQEDAAMEGFGNILG